MKKAVAFVLVLALAFCFPFDINGAMSIVIDDSNPVTSSDNGDGTRTDVYNVVVKTTEGESVETVDIAFNWKSGVKTFTCNEIQGWKVAQTSVSDSSAKCTYTAEAGQTGDAITVGQITAIVNKDSSDADCSIEYQFAGSTGKINPETGSNVSYIIVGLGVVAATIAYLVSKKRSKLYNI